MIFWFYWSYKKYHAILGYDTKILLSNQFSGFFPFFVFWLVNVNTGLRLLHCTYLHGSIFYLGICMSESNHQCVSENGLFQLSGGAKCLFTTSIWQVIDIAHVVYGSWFSWKQGSSPRFGIRGSRFFSRVAFTMILKSFCKSF